MALLQNLGNTHQEAAEPEEEGDMVIRCDRHTPDLIYEVSVTAPSIPKFPALVPNINATPTQF